MGKKKTIEIRELIINSLLNNVKWFVKGPYENLLKEQIEVKQIISSEEEQNREEINKLIINKLKTMITYDNMNQNILAFDENETSINFKIILSNNVKKDEYMTLNELYNSQPNNNFEPLKKPKDKTEKELLDDLLDLFGAENDIKKKEYSDEIKKIFPTYVFTTDNYIKMIHILMKTRANVPIVMMGETGCGKTSLIKMLYLIKNKGKNIKMNILNIHQGIGDDEIISFLEKVMKETKEEDTDKFNFKKKEFINYFIEENNKYIEKEKRESKNKKNKIKKADNRKEENEMKKFHNGVSNIEKEVKERKIWIFFDEINTSDSIGLISEIFCNRTYRGNPIPKRYIFIGACNPYRLLSEKSKNLELGLEHKKLKHKKNLVYTVNPLPHSLLNYIMDFGELSQKDTEKYIESMIKNEIDDFELLTVAMKSVKLCHLFIKENSDVSSVSLRDIKYFNIFYRGFILYLQYLQLLSKKHNYGMERKNRHLEDYKDMNMVGIKKRSINLSIYISYYLRLPTKQLREELSKKLDETNYFDFGFLHVPFEESKYILDQIDIDVERGIAKNNALRENIFCELFCLVNKVPLIICGKPGSSKTLSVQLILNNMKGKSSLNDFFKNPDFKEIIPYPFQGSTTCTSKGILKAFEKARKFSNQNEEMISLVFFDEMGLAEESIENPLKVLHSELDKEDNKIAFIGITNWTLDASKMNRGIRINVQEPDEKDLIFTSNEIAKSLDENLFKDNEELFKFLSQAYYEFRNDRARTGYKDFHGNRDFFHLIRNTIKYLKEEYVQQQYKDLIYIRTISAIRSIERNFGGYNGSVEDMKKIFYKISKYNDINYKYNIEYNIRDNLKDPNSRYLLLISQNSISQNLIEKIIKNSEKQSAIYIGSQFKGDKSESYAEEILFKIQIQMENEVILILKDLDIIYPSLYDLFNQNFSEFNGNKYARISFSSNQSTSLINNKFKVIILIDGQNIENEDNAFLNRFEKHIISFENLLSPEKMNLVKYINSNILDLIKCETNDGKNIKVNLKNQLICCEQEIIENLVYDIIKNDNNISDNKIISEIFKLISPTFSQDIISCMSINGFNERQKELAKEIENQHKITYKKNLIEYLNGISKDNFRHIIYTFSNVTEPILINKEKQNENSIFKKQNTTEIVIDSLETTKELEELLINSFLKTSNNLCIIKFEEEDLNKMNYVRNIIDSLEKIESTRFNKYYLFIVYMKREFINKEKNLDKGKIIKDQITLNDDNYKQIFIDNLNSKNEINIFELISEKNNNIIKNELDIIINENLYNCLNEINISLKNNNENYNINNYKLIILDGISKSDYLKKKFEEILIKNCKTIKEIITEILTDPNNFDNEDIELLSTIKKCYKKNIISILKKAIYIFEQAQILSSYLLYNNEKYISIIDSFAEDIDFKKINFRESLTIILGIKIPTLGNCVREINIFLKNNIIEKYSENENLLRNDLPEDMNESDAIKKYKKQKDELENNSKNQIDKIKYLNSILRINDLSSLKDILNDIYFYFLSEKYNPIPDIAIKILDYIILIYFFDKNSIKIDLSKNCATKIFELRKEKITQNDYDEYFKDIVKLFLFLNNYSEYIFFIINTCFEISRFSTKVQELFINSFITENFEQEKSERCLKYFEVVNIKLFKIFETLVFTIKQILYEEKERTKEIVIFIQSILSEMKQFNSTFSFYSKEIYTLQNLILTMKAFEKYNKNYDNNDLIQISSLLDKERKYINENKYKELDNNLEEIKKILIRNLDEKSDEYSSLFINILYNEYIIFQSIEHRKKIIEIISNSNNLIKKSIHILKFIFSGLELDNQEEEEDNIDLNKQNFDYENNSLVDNFKIENNNKIYNYIEQIWKEGNNTHTNILLFLFEYQIEKFFFKLKQKIINDINLEKIFFDSDSIPFIYFKTLLIIYIKIQSNDISFEKFNIYLLKLYSIAYIKRYASHYIDFKLKGEIISDGIMNDKKLNFQNNEDNDNEFNEIKIIKIYMLKLINQKGIDIFENQLEEKQLGFLKRFAENYKNKSKFNIEEIKHNDYCIFNLNKGYLDLNIDRQIDKVKYKNQDFEDLMDNFYSLLANQYIPKYLIKQNDFIIDKEIERFLQNIKENIYNYPQEIISFYENILSIEFYKNLKSKLADDFEFKEEKLNMILFILKFILISINNRKNNFFISLLNKTKSKEILKESYLPGIPLIKKNDEQNNVIEKEQNLILVDKKIFLKQQQNLSGRKIDDITFRILNFILYSHIFYSNVAGILSNEDIKYLEIEGMSVFNILEENYEIIKQQIAKNIEKIKDIKEYMNLVYYALKKDFEDSDEIFETKEKRDAFEKKINSTIDSSIRNYENNRFKTLKYNYNENLRFLKLNKESLEKIIYQVHSPLEPEYQNNHFLKELKYFMLSECPNSDLLKKHFNNLDGADKKYPILSVILNDNEKIKLLQNIPILNEISNSFRQYYSYNIERKIAQEKTIKSEKENIINNIFNGNQEKFKALMEKFVKSWNNIKEIATSKENENEMPIHEIKNYEDEHIAFFLMDKSDIKYGKYLTIAYQNLIEIQTNFINNILNLNNNDNKESIHNNYIKQLSQKIFIQDAKRNDILKFCNEEKLNEIIHSCSIRKCFDKDGIVKYNNYEGIEFDFDKIEESLCDYTLSQAKQFKKDITFVTYRFEGYSGKKSKILQKYIEKYKQRKLNKEEISAISDYRKNNKKINYIEFLFDLQKMINYIQEENYLNEYSLFNIYKNIPAVIHFVEIKRFIDMINEIGKNKACFFTVNSLIDFYNLFENVCWEEIKEKVSEEYKNKFDDEEKKNIKKYFDELDNKCIVNKMNLSTSIRRFISRYLLGKTEDCEFNKNTLLMHQLKKSELWDNSILEKPSFEKEMDKINNLFNIKLGYSFDLYELLGGDGNNKKKKKIKREKQ